ncbi:MAG: cell division protein FtsZ [Rhodospirillaceae bacterium]|jgi:cell division protein FtsZ|nr:cell division protein FtsZ [Rhodospirillaceae bacterium]
MSINLSVPEGSDNKELKPRITVIGVGGAGGNAVNNMIHRELEGVDFVVANTDAQALLQSRAERRIQLGATLTEGLGAGSKPDVGAAAAEEAHEELLHQLSGAHMAFIAAGMGGGTGTGAAPVIARAAKEAGILTVAVVTKPFQFEGSHRMRLAEAGIEELAQYVDTLIIIPNQNLFRIATENTTFADAFAMADEVLYSGVRGVTDLMVMPGLINLDFADIRSVMSEMGKAMMGTGEAEGERRALEAAEAAIANPLLDDTSMKGAKGVLINITGGSDITLFEVDEAASRIRAEVDQDAYIIIGSAFDGDLDGKMRVSVVATGIDSQVGAMPQPTMMRVTEAVSRVRPVVAEQPAPAPVAQADIEPVAAETIAPTVADKPEIAEEVISADSENLREIEAMIADPEPETMEEVVEAVESLDESVETAESSEESVEETADEPVEVAAAAFEAPAAMPRMGGIDAYIPPMPRAADAAPEKVKPDPFAAAAMTNGAQEAPNEKADEETVRPSLFERVTRTGRAALGRKAPDAGSSASIAPSQLFEKQAETPASAASAASAAPIETPTMTAMKPGLAAVAEAVQMEPEQAQMADLVPTEQAEAEEDDLLDIPAFLRRQAN